MSFKLDLLGDSFINSMLFRSLPNYFSYWRNWGGRTFWLLSKQSFTLLISKLFTQLAIRRIWCRKLTFLLILACSLSHFCFSRVVRNFWAIRKISYFNYLWRISISLRFISQSTLLALSLTNSLNSYLSTFFSNYFAILLFIGAP